MAKATVTKATVTKLEVGADAVAKERSDVEERSATRVLSPPPVLLGRLDAADGAAWLVEVGASIRRAEVDSSVDPVLLKDVARRGARVLLEAGSPLRIVGVLQTQRALTVDRSGDVKADVRSLEVNASESILLRTTGAFVRAKAREVEVYGDRVLTRARDLARTLSAMIKLN